MSVCKTASIAPESARHGGQPSLQGPEGGGRRPRTSHPLAGSSCPGSPTRHGAGGKGGETAQWLDNMLASNPCRDAFVSTSSIQSQTPAQAPINSGSLLTTYSTPGWMLSPNLCPKHAGITAIIPSPPPLFCDHFIEI